MKLIANLSLIITEIMVKSYIGVSIVWSITDAAYKEMKQINVKRTALNEPTKVALPQSSL